MGLVTTLLNSVRYRASDEEAKQPGPLDPWWYSLLSPPTASGEKVDEHNALNLSTVWACTRILCGANMSLPFVVYESTEAKGRPSKSVASDHWLYPIIHDNLNPDMTAVSARAVMFDWQLNWGNVYAEIVWTDESRTEAMELWPIHPSRIPKENIVKDKELDQLVYKVNNDPGEEPSLIEARDMIHIPSILNDNGWYGKGIIRHARESIGFGKAVDKQGAAYFKNSSRPSVVIKGGRFAKGDESREYYRRTWMQLHSGPEQNGMPALLPQDADIEVLSFSPEDSQFLETREFNVSDICRWYGVPPHMVYDLRRATFSNIEHQGIEFVVFSLIPWLKLWEAEFNRKLLSKKINGILQPDRNVYTKHVVEGLLRGDSTTRAEYYNKMFNIGVMSLNEIREKEDMNPLDQDVRTIPLNMQRIDEDGKQQTQSQPGEQEEPELDENGKPITPKAEGEEPLNLESNDDAASSGDIQATALNGAQIASLVQIVDKVVLDEWPGDSAKPALRASFPLMDEELINEMVNKAVEHEAPAPEPKFNPFAPEGEQQPEGDEEDNKKQDGDEEQDSEEPSDKKKPFPPKKPKALDMQPSVAETIAMSWLCEAMFRITRKEVRDAERAFKKGLSPFVQWLQGDYYSSFVEMLTNEISQPLGAFCQATNEQPLVDAREFASRYVVQSVSIWETMLNKYRDTGSRRDAMEAIVTAWSQRSSEKEIRFHITNIRQSQQTNEQPS